EALAALQAAFLEKAAAASAKRLEGLRIAERLPQAAAVATAYAAAPAGGRLTYDNFFSALGSWITPHDTLVSDAGFPLVGAQSVKIAVRNGFVAQAAWLAIGYSVGAATGVKFAQPDQRVLVVVGDGAFHETCQAVADHVAYGQNTVVFVLVNGLYGIEQEIVNPNPFRTPPVDYPDPQLDHVYPYNRLHSWHYDKIPDVFGGIGRKAGTVAELNAILAEIRTKPDASFVVEITLPTLDVPAGIASGLATDVGEDEFENPEWPPVDLF
ncbi:MAG TPA: thiamine pyrophosphate-dependent enzyme, partial [Thermoanaerobaculia bacterium]